MSVNIKIGDNYLVTSDKHQFILNQIAIKGSESKEAGTEHLKPIGFYPSVEQLVKALMQRELKASDAATLEQCRKILADTGAACLRALSKAKEA